MEEEEDWRSPIAHFIITGDLPNNGVEARKIKSRSCKFQMIQTFAFGPSSVLCGKKECRSGPLREYVKRCDSCQKMQVVPRQPVTEMTPVLCPIPFDMWGIDLVGQLFKPPVKYKDATVAVDYFSKWVENVPMNEGQGCRGVHLEELHHFLWNPKDNRF
ncbi:hypothetical protein LIER_07435 [Lithospermum erythrorhizon]|uniref:Uncharacterized protein n=1 Tax=Lithospermum erythrorhizon TaxID=34254 RepID=A0AAV3P8I7_LITER